ncbi:MAG: HpcH/HpaI aldolase/citrate lyase family protein [Pigmentiphaga sp.]
MDKAFVFPADRFDKPGRALANMWVTSSCPLLAETLAVMSFDVVTLDAQHGLTDDVLVANSVRAIQAAGSVAFVRLADSNGAHVGRILDFGAQGIICPMINTAEDARRLIEACRYPPLGNRSFGPVRAGLHDPVDYFSRANDGIVVLAMVETAEALRNVDQILAVDGISGVYLGPVDLSISLGLGLPFPRASDDLVASILKVRDACQRAGKWAAVHQVPGHPATYWVQEGFNFVTLGMDFEFLRRSAAQELAQFS